MSAGTSLVIAHLAILVLGTLLDRLVGDPPALWRRVPHPVVLFGRAIDGLDGRFNRTDRSQKRRRIAGLVAVCALLLTAILGGLVLSGLLRSAGWPGLCAEIGILAIFLAQKSLSDHVSAVARALQSGGVEAGRHAVSLIVGRDPAALDEAGICRAAIESLAENASDGVVAPFLFYLAFGLPGLFAYKMLNTADSMIGHMDERHRAFGCAAARLDDLANFVSARATVGLIALAALSTTGAAAARAALRAAKRDGRRHRSPNAGWPEAAMAGALGLSLGGPRRYGSLAVEAPFLNGSGRREARIADIGVALAIYRRLCDALLCLPAVALAVTLILSRA